MLLTKCGNIERTQSSLLLLSRQLILKLPHIGDKKTYCYHMLKKYWVGICVLHLTNQAAGLRFIMSNYSQLSNCSTSIVKVKRWFSCSYLFRNVQFSWPYQECTISTEMYNSTIAEEMSVCNSSMWEFILVSRVDFFTNQGWIGFLTQNSQK